MKRGLILVVVVGALAVAYFAGKNSVPKAEPPSPASLVVVTQVQTKKVVQFSTLPPASQPKPAVEQALPQTDVPLPPGTVTPYPEKKVPVAPPAAAQVPVAAAPGAPVPVPTAVAVPVGTLLEFKSKPGDDTKVRLDGDSSIHKWWVEGKLISGILQLGPAGLTQAGHVPAVTKIIIPVKSLHSSSGSPMDDVMYEHMHVDQGPDFIKITFWLTDLELRKPPSDFIARGDLCVHGVTNRLEMPVKIQAVEGGDLRITGATNLKMTDFKIEPPCPKFGLGLITTSNEVAVSFSWHVTPRATP